MVWQRIIQVMGGVAIVFGVLSMCNNLSEFAAGFIGPEAMMEEAEKMPAMMQDSSKANARAFEHGVFRGYSIVQGALNSAMAVVLIAAGIGLLRLRLWGRRLALVWSIYAVVGSVVSVVMVGRYLLPEFIAVSNQPLPAGFEVFASAIILLALWFFPVTLFTLLKLPTVMRMMEAAAHAPRPQVQPFDPPLPAPVPGPAPHGMGDTQASAGHNPSAPPPAEQTWRDDPWNDPSAT